MVLSTLRRAARRAVRSPFPPGSGKSDLLVHSCHHKVGTVWFKRVLNAVAETYGLRVHSGPQSALGRQDIFIDDHSRVDRSTLRPYRSSHLIRDPRDVVVSAYFYHLRTTEAWALEPDDRYGGLSYQEHLKQFDTEEGLGVEIQRSAATILRDMVAWDYNDPRGLELRYEDHLADEETGFRRLFTHYGFAQDAVDAAVEIALSFSLSKVKATTTHIRSGQPNDWENHFTPALKTLFKEETGDAALKLGYADNPDW